MITDIDHKPTTYINPSCTLLSFTLLQAGEAQLGTEESVFNKVLCRRHFNQLNRIFEIYAEKNGRTVQEAVESEIGGDTQNGYLALGMYLYFLATWP